MCHQNQQHLPAILINFLIIWKKIPDYVHEPAEVKHVRLLQHSNGIVYQQQGQYLVVNH